MDRRPRSHIRSHIRIHPPPIDSTPSGPIRPHPSPSKPIHSVLLVALVVPGECGLCFSLFGSFLVFLVIPASTPCVIAISLHYSSFPSSIASPTIISTASVAIGITFDGRIPPIWLTEPHSVDGAPSSSVYVNATTTTTEPLSSVYRAPFRFTGSHPTTWFQAPLQSIRRAL